MTAVNLTHRENYDISQCLKYHSKCLIFGAKIQIGDTNQSLFNFFGIFFRGIFSHSVFFFLRVIFKPRMWILWETYHFLRHLLRNLRMFQLKNLSLQKGKRGMSPKGNFVKIVWQFLLSLWCRMISTPNSGKGTEFFLSTRSEFNSAKMQSTECMEGAEEIQGPDLVTLRLELVTFSFSYSSVISSISSSICERYYRMIQL